MPARVAALALPAAACGARCAAQDGPGGERHRQRTTEAGRSDVQRGGGAAVRDRLGYRRGGSAGAAGPPQRSPANPDTLLVPLERTHEGWYLVFWRAISVDGHPVRGAFTFAVGPNAGPAPQFPVPSTSESAATPRLLVARWVVFLAVMAAIGLLALRLVIARPVVRRVGGTSLRSLSIAFGVAAAVGLVAIPVYLLVATADFALRSVFAIGSLVPLFRRLGVRARLPRSGALLCVVRRRRGDRALGRPARSTRSARSSSSWRSQASALAAAATLARSRAPSGHAGQTSPRGLSLLFDWVHLALRLSLVRWSRRPDRPLVQPSRGLPGRGPRRHRAALLERRSRVRDRPDRVRCRARRCSTSRRWRLSGRRRTARHCS